MSKNNEVMNVNPSALTINNGQQTINAHIGDNHITNNYPPITVFIQNENGIPLPKVFTYDSSHFNLFVVDDENQFIEKSFCIIKEQALTFAPDKITNDKYKYLTKESIESIKQFPCIFASRNHLTDTTDENHYAYFGFISDVKVLKDEIKIMYYMIAPIKQLSLLSIMDQLKIIKKHMNNEFNKIHWTIKDVDLLSVLDSNGINYIPFLRKQEVTNE